MGRKSAEARPASITGHQQGTLKQLESLRAFVAGMGFTETELTDCLRQCGFNVNTAAAMLMTGEYKKQKGSKKAFLRMTSSPGRKKAASSTTPKGSIKQAFLQSTMKRKNPPDAAQSKPTKRKSPSSVAGVAMIDLSVDENEETETKPSSTPMTKLASKSDASIETPAASTMLTSAEGWLLCQRWISDAICTSRNGAMNYQECFQLEASGPTSLRLRGRALQARFPEHIGRLMNPLLRENLVSLEAQSLMQESKLPTGASIPISLRVCLPDPRKFFQVFRSAGTETANILFWEKSQDQTKSSRKAPPSLEQAAFDLLQWAHYGDVPDFQAQAAASTTASSSSDTEEKVEDLDENDFETASVDESNQMAKEWSESLTSAERTAQLPECEEPTGFKNVQLRPYQKQALQWMRQREVGELTRGEVEEQLALLAEMSSATKKPATASTTTTGSKGIDIECECGPVLASEKAQMRAQTCDGQVDPVSHPLWQRRFMTDAKREKLICFFVNEFMGIASHLPPAPPKPCSGGILADAMGLGKTVMLLSLILRGKQEKPRGSRSVTLVVAKLSVLPQWEDEIRSKTNLSFATYYGAQASRDFTISELENVDIVLTTYGTMQGELNRKNPLLMKTKWLRVILDEAHCCRNERTLASKACCALDAAHRWAVSGTIMMNSVQDLYGIFKFLQHEPWCLPSFWKAAVTRPMSSFENGSNTDSTEDTTESLHVVLNRLRQVLVPIMLRRTKDSLTKDGEPILTLPPVESKTVHVELMPTERQFYQAILARSLQIFDGFIDKGTASKSYIQILSMISRLRQCCDHISLTVRRRMEEADDVDHSESPGNASDGRSDSKKKSAAEFDDNDLLGNQFINDLIAKLAVSPRRHARVASKNPHSGTTEQSSYLKSVASSLSQSVGNEETHTDEECPICLEPVPISDSLLTPCGHIFCKDCLIGHLKQNASSKNEGQYPDGSCPVCNEPVKSRRLVTLRSASDDPRRVVSDYFKSSSPAATPLKSESSVVDETYSARSILREAVDGHLESSKMKAVLDELEKIWELDPGSKVIIFSQFLGFLDLLQPKLSAIGVSFSRLDGQMSLSRRVEVLKDFRSTARRKGDNAKGSVLLMSMNAGGEGLNLVAASTVFLVDPWWNTAKEDQCINRIVRLGQTAPICRVRKFVVKQSVEERIVELQNRKQYVADELYETLDRPEGASTIGGSARLTLEDLQSLFQS